MSDEAGSDRTVRDLVQRLAASWNAADWKTFAELFAEDATYVTGTASLLSGRAEVRREVAAGPHYEVTLAIEAVKTLAPDIVLVVCSWSASGDPRSGLLTLVVQGTPSGWRIVALHNTDRGD